MKKENLAYLIGGLAFGFLFGFGLFQSIEAQPGLDGGGGMPMAQRPAGPSAPSQTNPGGAGAPMMAEIRALKERLDAEPGDVKAATRLANLYYQAGMFDPAIEFYEMALKTTPGDPNLLTDMGNCFRAKQDFERALALFAEANAADPGHWQSLFNTVVVAGFDLRRFDQASLALDTMETMDPRPPRLDELRQALEAAKAEADGSADS